MRFLTHFLFLIFCSQLFAQSQTNERAKWFTDARFGMFIHWGVYSGAEGIWKGEKHRDDNNYAEWVIDNFLSRRMGTIGLPEKGVYDIELEIIPANDEQVKFQWLWLK